MKKRVVSIDPIFPDYVSKYNEYFVIDYLNNKCVLRGKKTDKILTIGEDPYLRYNRLLLDNIDNNKELIFITPAILPQITNKTINCLLEEYGNKIKGIKLYSGTSTVSLDSIKDFKYCLPLLIHTGLEGFQSPDSMYNFISEYPGNICLAHFARFEPTILQLVKERKNLFIDISPTNEIFNRISNGRRQFFINFPFYNPQSMITRLIDAVGIEHIIWGSDFPFGSNESIEPIMKLNLTKQKTDMLLYDNAIRYLNV